MADQDNSIALPGDEGHVHDDHSMAIPVALPEQAEGASDVPVPGSDDHGSISIPLPLADPSSAGIIIPETAPIIALPGLSDPNEADAAASTAMAYGGVAIPSLDMTKDEGEEGDDLGDQPAPKPRKKRKNSSEDGAPAPKRQKSAPAGPNEARCTCKRSQCLKSYCTCFASGLFCEGCGCKDCVNLPAFAAQVDEARKKTIGRNPIAFRNKVEDNKHIKGCKCTKTACLKKYCECYEQGVHCSEQCKCLNCKNRPGMQ